MRTGMLAALCAAGLLPLHIGCDLHGQMRNPQAKAVTITADENGQTVKAVVAGRLILSLASNPTTGYDWKITAIDPTILKQAGESTFKQDSSEPGKVGVGGTRTWNFDIKTAGSTKLTLEYRRPWEAASVPAGQTFTVTVEATK